MILNYRHRTREGDWEPIEQRIFFDLTACNYGGNRTWFLCPRCSRRVAVLYRGKYFLCRHCHDLAYSSQQENQIFRLMRKAQKIRRKLGASHDLLEPIWFKPKRMHQKTFKRLRREADETKELFSARVRQRFGIDLEWFL